MPRDREWCRAAGMDDFVAKPYRPQALFDTLARVLRGPAPARSAACSVQNGAAVEVPAAAPVAWAIGLEQCMGQEVHFRRILARFIDGHAEDPRRIDGALEQDAPGDAAEVAHKLVSSAGIIGALKLSAMARELQETLRDEPPAARPDLLAKLRAEHAVVVDAVRARLVDV
jgi:HPt (histidine-containing phosphotransfer) domain-containing protein